MLLYPYRGDIMKKIRDRMTVLIWFVVLLFLCASFLTQCSLMYGNREFVSDNLSYDTNSILNICFASTYTWPIGEKHVVLDIPDTYDGYRVTALGGYVGSGAPSPFMANLPNTLSVCSEDTLPNNAQIDQYHLVLNIGKYLREDKLIVMDYYHKVGTNQYVQVLVTVNCSPENPYFYSEDGKLYKRLDDSLVEGFFYYSDYYDSLNQLHQK